jgi:hypothetical protein
MPRASQSSGGSRGYRQTATKRTWRHQKIVQQSPPPPMGEILATIHQNDLQDSKFDNKDAALITESQYLASYNWLNRKENRILVPGKDILTTSQTSANGGTINRRTTSLDSALNANSAAE